MPRHAFVGPSILLTFLLAGCGFSADELGLDLANVRGGGSRAAQAPGRTGQTPGQSGARPPGLAGTAPGHVDDATPDPVCGNGVLENGEACDDGNTSWCDGCTPACSAEAACDDRDACTMNACLPESGCTYPIDPAACRREPDPALSIAEGPGLDEVPVLADATFTVRLYDIDGPLTTGGDDVTVTITGASVLSVLVQDLADGAYACTYRLGQVDEYTFDVRVGGVSLPGFPTTRVAMLVPSAAQSFVSGPATTRLYRNIAAVFTIDPVSESGIPTSSNSFLARFSATIVGPGAASVTLTNAPGGKYSGLVLVDSVGTYTVSVTFDGQPLSNTPFSVEAREPPDASQSSAVGAGLTSALVGVPALFSVIARDANGVQCSGGDDITAEITGTAAITPAVIDNGDGTYTFIYTADAPGPYLVTITIFGENVPGSPFALTVA